MILHIINIDTDASCERATVGAFTRSIVLVVVAVAVVAQRIFAMTVIVMNGDNLSSSRPLGPRGCRRGQGRRGMWVGDTAADTAGRPHISVAGKSNHARRSRRVGGGGFIQGRLGRFCRLQKRFGRGRSRLLSFLEFRRLRNVLSSSFGFFFRRFFQSCRPGSSLGETRKDGGLRRLGLGVIFGFHVVIATTITGWIQGRCLFGGVASCGRSSGDTFEGRSVVLLLLLLLLRVVVVSSVLFRWSSSLSLSLSLSSSSLRWQRVGVVNGLGILASIFLGRNNPVSRRQFDVHGGPAGIAGFLVVKILFIKVQIVVVVVLVFGNKGFQCCHDAWRWWRHGRPLLVILLAVLVFVLIGFALLVRRGGC
mmetsp:Transcript_11056/g.24751  ORF Transcript_11056/g.24751 Transcript_11056/m.24751 type:complete len:365 (-) Transcript_11056:69-1163(-)